MKKIVLFLALLFIGGNLFSQERMRWLGSGKSFFSAAFLNQNVYKTQIDLNLIPVYKDSGGRNGGKKEYAKVDTGSIYTLKVRDNNPFIRYKVVYSDDSGTFIRVLAGCEVDTSTKLISTDLDNRNQAEDFIYKIKDDLEPNNHYLASSALIGNVLTLPLKYRELDESAHFSGSFTVAYGFGWKFKLGNHPYHKHYLNIMPYAVGIGTQKYFTRLNDGTYSERKDELSLTYMAMGISYEYYKFNIGVFAGQDIMFGSNKDWVFNDKWWYGLGVGYKIFQKED